MEEYLRAKWAFKYTYTYMHVTHVNTSVQINLMKYKIQLIYGFIRIIKQKRVKNVIINTLY